MMPLRAFTLVETMIAIAILAIALVGPYTAIRSSLNASYVARDELVASSLAQEGMEYIRSVRDNNYLNGRTWLDGLATYTCYGAAPTHYCTIDTVRGDIHQDADAMEVYAQLSSVPNLKLSSVGLYTYQSGTDTSFNRTVQIRTVGTTAVEVTVTVSWVTAQKTFSVVVTDMLYDWI